MLDHQGHTPPPASGSDRQFGWVFSALFAIIALWPLGYGQMPRLWALAIACAFAACTLLRPSLLAPLNRLWFRFGLLLHRVMNPLILGLMYAVAIAPLGLIMRLCGRDTMQRRFDAKQPTYWITRTPPGKADDGLKNQF